MHLKPFLFLIVLISCNRDVYISSLKNDVKEYSVGKSFFVLEDSTRIDPLFRKLRIINMHVWYPIETQSDKNFEKTEYIHQIDLIEEELNNFVSNNANVLKNIESHSLKDAPILKAKKPYPLILFSPSLGGNLQYFTYYAEKLAQSGYIVAGLNHLYESAYVFDKENKIIPANISFHDSLKSLNIPKDLTADQYRLEKGKRQKVLGEDLIFALDELEKLNSSNFSKQIDITQIGIFGHSFGGGSVIYAAYLDNRFDAVINLDGTPATIGLMNGIDQDFLFLEDLIDYKNHPGYKKLHKRRAGFADLSRGDAYRILFKGFNHNSFADINMHMATSEEEYNSAKAQLDLSFTYIQEFFGHYLKQQKFELKAGIFDRFHIFIY